MNFISSLKDIYQKITRLKIKASFDSNHRTFNEMHSLCSCFASLTFHLLDLNMHGRKFGMQNPNKRKISRIMRTYSKMQYAFPPLALWYRAFYKY
jgi:hypothetical protein